MHYGEPRLFEGMEKTWDARGDDLYALAWRAWSRAAPARSTEWPTSSRLRSGSAEGRGAEAEALWDASARVLAAG